MNAHHCTYCRKVVTRAVHPNTKRPFCDSTCYGLWQRGRTFEKQGKPTREAKQCNVRGCDSPHFAKGFCRAHYMRLHYIKPKTKTDHTTRPELSCAHCGTKFLPSHKDAVYCSLPCSGAARKKPFIIKKGYKKLLIASHPRADAHGYVFEHIIVAEAMLGRPLRKGEEVHHKDFNKQNNHPSNLVVCKDHAEHMRYHLTPSTSSE